MTSIPYIFGGAEFDFLFSFSPDEPLPLPPTSLSPPSSPYSPPSSEPPVLTPSTTYVECLFYRKGWEDDYFHWAGNLTAGAPIPFGLPGTPGLVLIASYPDNNNCKGSFWLYTNTQTGVSFVWFDLFYGPDYEGEFEGTMVQYVTD